MPTLYEARCLNCGNLGHYKEECPRIECRKCHSLGHTGSVCHVKLPDVKFDSTYIVDEKPDKEEGRDTIGETETEGEEHLEKYYVS
mmetsp:Transcript_20989/g.44926  ORF Transcript_20989/g.44926 Transcript_20989/m.44926 type:complete len:86 (+) Transcript_20989:274-531(+)|eukprot:CAMPEP_0172554484 /NCGR_PEP_ID=MMETSP1067-20121228/54803_1 /TAXON_ID=265564 ORGANISM="Thalassiosira punctigera, Strain Tpunct2005C2" /NCGR_SAMPLE_ID=MMETSP1067 /ASSEMBLY_ACC=CAM_ASM_000444 /LENGTH=85 /DNA_ID=CAMNT_0013342863 /DNA_START=249 /DNA_END=506 /DNA_ORIENTATION=+